MRGVWHTGDCGGGGDWSGLWLLAGVVAAAGMVAAFLIWIFHFLIDALTAIGLLTLVAVYVRVKWRQSWHPPKPQPLSGSQQQPVAGQQQQALPAGSVHHHYGNTLQLGDNVSLDDVMAAMRRSNAEG